MDEDINIEIASDNEKKQSKIVWTYFEKTNWTKEKKKHVKCLICNK